MVHTINNVLEGFSPLMLYYEDIARIMYAFDSFSCNHVYRTGNTLARLVTRWNVNELKFILLNNIPPIFLTELDLI